MTESMDAADYAFYLAYGMTQEDESFDSLLDVKMYNMLIADASTSEESNLHLLFENPQAA